ncbi:MAG: response regulator transcription factor [Chloroflexota bacterium]|nr:response regulator transcription factor [Chloroflexota bacterium]
MSNAAKILVVDDEQSVRLSLAELLSMEGHKVTTASSGKEALRYMEEITFDLILLDLIMPGMDGLQVMEIALQLAPDIMIIMLTAHGTLESAIAALRQGAHDYLLKPCAVDDILTSVSAGLEKHKREAHRKELVTVMEETIQELKTAHGIPVPRPTADEKAEEEVRFLQARGIIVDKQKHLASMNGEPLDLTPTELRLLACLLANADRVLSSRELVKEVQNYDCREEEARSIIRVHIRRLRRKVEPDPRQPQYIINVRGVGYMFATNSQS